MPDYIVEFKLGSKVEPDVFQVVMNAFFDVRSMEYVYDELCLNNRYRMSTKSPVDDLVLASYQRRGVTIRPNTADVLPSATN